MPQSATTDASDAADGGAGRSSTLHLPGDEGSAIADVEAPARTNTSKLRWGGKAWSGGSLTVRKERVRVAGVAFDVLTESEVVSRILDALDQGRGGTVTTVNVDHLLRIRRGSTLGALVEKSDLTVADGAPIVWAARLQGTPLPGRVAGASLLWTLSAAAAEANRSVFLLGGRPGAADEARKALAKAVPSLRIAISCPPRGFERDDAELAAVVSAVKSASPDIIFTALGAPKQEWLNELMKAELPHSWSIGMGGAIDMAAGFVHRAPAWAQRIGLEWIFRLVQEPRRLGRRYLVDDLPFALRLMVVAGTERLRKHRSSGPQ